MLIANEQLIITGTSVLGIFISRKNKLIKKFYIQNTYINICRIILTIFAFKILMQILRTLLIQWVDAFGYVYIWSTLCVLFGVLAMKKFKFNKKLFWNSWFLLLFGFF